MPLDQKAKESLRYSKLSCDKAATEEVGRSWTEVSVEDASELAILDIEVAV